MSSARPRPHPFVADLGPNGGLWCSPTAAALIAHCLQAVAKLNGTPLTPGTMQGDLYRCAATVASTTPPSTSTSSSPAHVGDEISADQAAVLLDVSPHHVRLLARREQLPGARRVKNRWRIPRAVVLAYADHRDADRSA